MIDHPYSSHSSTHQELLLLLPVYASTVSSEPANFVQVIILLESSSASVVGDGAKRIIQATTNERPAEKASCSLWTTEFLNSSKLNLIRHLYHKCNAKPHQCWSLSGFKAYECARDRLITRYTYLIQENIEIARTFLDLLRALSNLLHCYSSLFILIIIIVRSAAAPANYGSIHGASQGQQAPASPQAYQQPSYR